VHKRTGSSCKKEREIVLKSRHLVCERDARDTEALFGFTSDAFGKRCREAGAMPRIGTVDDAHDNAMPASFFATLEREVLRRRRFKGSGRSDEGDL
jgi:hypothetical protein